MKDIMHEDSKIQFYCRRCGHRLFDYVGGDFTIEIKCKKCKRVLIVKSAVYQELIKGIQNNKIAV